MRRQSRGFEDSSSSSFVFCGGGIGLPSGLGVLVHVLIRRLPQRRNVAISISRSLWWSHCTQTAIVPNRPSSVGAQEFPPNACRGERCGVLGAQSPHQTSSSHRRKRFVGLTGFPERQQQNSELSGHSNNGPLLGLSGAVLGES